MEKSFMLEVEKVSKRYTQQNGEAFMALSDVSFSLKPGEILGIIGKNGSGKSTLLKMLAGFIKPSEGTIKIGGKSIGIIDVGSGFHPDLTGLENIRFMLRFHAAQNPDALEKSILQFSELGDFIHEPVKNYSSGMFMRLALSTYLNMDFQVLFIDEVFSTGDADFQQKVKSFIRTREKELTLVLASHDLHLIATLADSCIWLKSGKIHAQGKAVELVQAYREEHIEHAFGQLQWLNTKPQDNGYEDECISLHSVRILQDGQASGVIYFDADFSICFDFSYKQNQTCAFALRVQDLSENQLHLDSTAFRKEPMCISQPGDYTLNVTYPGGLLTNGKYKLSLILWIGEQYVKEISGIAFFELAPNPNQVGKIGSEVPSFSRFPLRWKLGNE